MGFFIYKYIDNGEIVYIGQSINLPLRIEQHKTDKLKDLNDIWFFECNNKTEMNSYEYFLIQKYKPRFNIIFNKEYNKTNNTTLLNFTEPKWIQYDTKQFETTKKANVSYNKKIQPIKTLNYSIFEEKTIENISQSNYFDLMSYSLIEQKIIIFSTFNQEEFDLQKYFEFTQSSKSGNNYMTLNTAIQKLLSIKVLTKHNNKLKLNSKKIQIILPEDILKMVFNANTKYFIPVLNSTFNNYNFYISTEWLKKQTSYKTTKDINSRIIKPICQVLDKHKIKYSFEIEKNGQQYTGFIIKFNEVNKNDN